MTFQWSPAEGDRGTCRTCEGPLAQNWWDNGLPDWLPKKQIYCGVVCLMQSDIVRG